MRMVIVVIAGTAAAICATAVSPVIREAILIGLATAIYTIMLFKMD